MAPRAQGMDLMGAEYAKDAIRTAAAVLCGRVDSTILRITVLSRAEVACDGLREQKRHRSSDVACGDEPR